MTLRWLITVAAMAFLTASLLLFAVPVDSAARADTVRSGRVPVPKPAKGKGSKCVADTAFMRRYHMDMLGHQRDDTVHDGIRAKRFSLKGCVECHAVKGTDGKPVTVKSPKHFCRNCHDYAAVRIDCFQCHASRPTGAAGGRSASVSGARSDEAALASYLKGVRR